MHGVLPHHGNSPHHARWIGRLPTKTLSAQRGGPKNTIRRAGAIVHPPCLAASAAEGRQADPGGGDRTDKWRHVQLACAAAAAAAAADRGFELLGRCDVKATRPTSLHVRREWRECHAIRKAPSMGKATWSRKMRAKISPQGFEATTETRHEDERRLQRAHQP